MKQWSGKVARVFVAVAFAVTLDAASPMASPSGPYVPCRIEQRTPIHYPTRALHEGVMRGEAQLMLEIDRTGQLADLLIVAHTRREFADAAADAVKQWRFKPGFVGDEPIGSNVSLTVAFTTHGVLAYVKPVAASDDKRNTDGDYEYSPCSVKELDHVPATLEQTGPIYPREWIEQGRVGTVILDFFIDEEGRVRFPSISGNPDELLAATAVNALKQWRFEPPKKNGRPVLVRAQQRFDFRPITPPRKS